MHTLTTAGKRLKALGLMSGTSMDGIDVAMIETDGDFSVRRGPSFTYPYSAEFRAQLVKGLEDARQIVRRDDRPGRLKLLEQYITELHAEAVGHFLADCQLKREDIDVVGFHGHTVLHRASSEVVARPVASRPGVDATIGRRQLTVQIGDGKRLAALIGIDVVYDMRARDCEMGGQGAPLVPVYHRALAGHLTERPVAILNIGGVANVTWIGRENQIVAFDVGPGNALLDDWMMSRREQPMDTDGACAREGEVNQAALRQLIYNPFFSALPPKSLDRNAFQLAPVSHLSTEDGAATLTAFTANAVSRARSHFPEEPKIWVVTGGGRRNKVLMATIAGYMEGAVVPAEAVEWDGDSMEAEAWAYLAVRSLAELPITFATTTGAPGPLTGGVLARSR
jgi:anhydro-N-acetylmuramic acid kinase